MVVVEVADGGGGIAGTTAMVVVADGDGGGSSGSGGGEAVLVRKVSGGGARWGGERAGGRGSSQEKRRAGGSADRRGCRSAVVAAHADAADERRGVYTVRVYREMAADFVKYSSRPLVVVRRTLRPIECLSKLLVSRLLEGPRRRISKPHSMAAHMYISVGDTRSGP